MESTYFLANRRMQSLQQKIEGLSSSREEMERRTLRLRDALADVVAKVDDMALDVKDAQGQVIQKLEIRYINLYLRRAKQPTCKLKMTPPFYQVLIKQSTWHGG